MSPLIRPILALIALGTVAHADPTSGVDTELFRSSYDPNGLFAVEGARLMPAHDLAFKLLLGLGTSPIQANVPGIGDAKDDKILGAIGTVDMTFGMSLSERIALGIDLAAYRTTTGDGYGVRGRYATGGLVATPSTGLISLRPLSNIDPSGHGANAYTGEGHAGPLDARFGLKVGLFADAHMALALVGSVFLPFGEDEMLLGDRNLVFEPKLAFEYRTGALRVVANAAARLRQRTVLQAEDPTAAMVVPKAILDVGSELVLGGGVGYELAPRMLLAAELQAFVPLPDGTSWGSCKLYSGAACATLTSGDYATGAKHGDLAAIAAGGLNVRIDADVTASLMIGAGLTGARGSDFSITTGIVWAPQPAGVAAPGRNDRDGDGIPDSADSCPDEAEDKDGYQDEDGCPELDNDGDGIPDAKDKCPNEPEDKDGYQDEDGCPEPDNDGDGIPDTLDKCPNEPEDKDGFEDEDGCPDPDNDHDGFPDGVDKCPNDPETVNGFEDEDGCPDVRGTSGPEERADRIDIKGQPIAFAKGTATLTGPAKALLGQIATLIKQKKLTIRAEVHVPLGAKVTGGAVAAQKKKDKAFAQQRATAILNFLVAQGVPQAQLQAVGIGSDRPLGTSNPTDAINERVDFIKAQQ